MRLDAPIVEPVQDHMTYWVDGGCNNGCPGDSVYFSVVEEDAFGETTKIIEQCQSLEYTTNNEAEYLAVKNGLITARRRCNAPGSVTVKSDSRLVVNQLNGEWATKSPNLVPLWKDTRELLNSMQLEGFAVLLMWVPREDMVQIVGH